MDYSDTYDELNITLGDNDDVTFTPEEKIRALRKAWNDPYVVNVVWDSSLTFTSTVADYALPSTLTSVKGIYISASNSTADLPDPIDSSLWQAGVLLNLITIPLEIIRYHCNVVGAII